MKTCIDVKCRKGTSAHDSGPSACNCFCEFAAIALLYSNYIYFLNYIKAAHDEKFK
jgi:hypothetical protein